MNTSRHLRQIVGVCAVSITPILGVISWDRSPGKDAFFGALAYWPILLLTSGVAALITTGLYFKRSLPAGFLVLPGVIVGTLVFCHFVTLDYRSERIVFSSPSGLRGVIYEDESGEFGIDYIFAVERSNGELVGEVFLGWHMSGDEVDFQIREVDGQLQVVNLQDSSSVIAWYSPASGRVLSYRR